MIKLSNEEYEALLKDHETLMILSQCRSKRGGEYRRLKQAADFEEFLKQRYGNIYPALKKEFHEEQKIKGEQPC